MRQLLEAGVHFGHQTQRWNPLMSEFIYGDRNGIHIIDLTQTVPMLDAALNAVRETVAKGGRLLFVGTKRQAQRPIAEAAEKCAQYYMNHRWLGGTLTNWKTVSQSINRLNDIDAQMSEGSEGLTKRERLSIERDRNKLQSSLGGIREMGGLPNMLFVIDVNKEALAVAEANKLGIPVVAVVDTNCSPEGIDYIIPGNDDAARAIALFCDLAATSALDGMSAQMSADGIDMGGMEEAPAEKVLTEGTASDVAEEAPAEDAASAPAGKAPAKKTASSTAKKAPAKKAASSAAKKAAAGKAASDAAEKPPAKKPASSTAKKATSGKAASSAGKKAPAKKAASDAAGKPPAKKAAAGTAKKAPVKKSASNEPAAPEAPAVEEGQEKAASA